ncbi:M23 family metallopeptidase [Chondrinema litorale]|uniref:M23 family metallopeptidase n=1 Tax=Chondrinema litorale TaxID=2994555 RepID=UPI002544438B|nr:M23 family metallopeptidase [Chondrinema litorale]UZR95050.1 M23 family metallopeptidase [Chondrinema litorale]
MKQKKKLSNWLSSRFLLIIRHEENFAEKATIKFSYVKLFLVIGGIFVLFSGLSFLLVTTVLSKWFDPRIDYVKMNSTLIEMQENIDSLMVQMEIKEKSLTNFRNVLTGNVDFVVFENPVEDDSVTQNAEENAELAKVESDFRKQFEESDYDQLNFINNAKSDLQQLFFFTPIDGVISRKYSISEGHYGLDIVARKNEPVKAVSDGTVLISSWTQDSGHVIAVQHKHQLISFYKHNSARLKNVGDVVKAGDIIAIIGNSGELTDGPHLHFELWYDGNAVNPEDFMTF